MHYWWKRSVFLALVYIVLEKKLGGRCLLVLGI